MNSGIYQIQNVVSGKRYIGSAVNIRRRWSEHRSQLRRNCHNNPHLQCSWNKQGEKFFSFSILLYCSGDRLLVHEQGAIDSLHPEFNIAKNACAPMLGRSHSLVTIAKLRTNFLGHTHTDEAKQKMSMSAKLRRASPETRAKLSKALIGNSRALGYKQTDEVKARVVAAPRTPEARANHREAMKRPETRAKISSAAMGNTRRLGVSHSEETLAKMSSARLAYWKARRNRQTVSAVVL